jgi:RNA polymerase sigma-70 factor (ECF subfamily)
MTEGRHDAGGLAERLRSGDEHALADLFSRHRSRLEQIVEFRLDRRLTGRVDSDDVLQEAYLDAAERIEHFVNEHSGSVFVWLRLIVYQTLANVHRRHLGAQMRDVSREFSIFGQRGQQDASTSLALQLLGRFTTPSQAAIREETAEKLTSAIELLGPLDREVLTLRHFEQLTNSEVAEVLGIQKKAASIRYIRALRRLKLVLENTPGFSGESSTKAV